MCYASSLPRKLTPLKVQTNDRGPQNKKIRLWETLWGLNMFDVN